MIGRASCAVICGWLKRLKACTSPGQCNLCQMSPGCMCECSISHRLCVYVCAEDSQSWHCCRCFNAVLFSLSPGGQRSGWAIEKHSFILYHSKNLEQIDLLFDTYQRFRPFAWDRRSNNNQYFSIRGIYHVAHGYSLYWLFWFIALVSLCFLLSIWDTALMTTAF